MEMTYKEALHCLEDHETFLKKADHARNGFSLYIREVIDYATAAIEKQIPKAPSMKPMAGFDPVVASHLACPTCGDGVTNYWVPGTKPKHCQFCGQALDWGEEADQ